MPTPSLKEFAQAAPVCQQTSGLAAVLEIFRTSRCDAIVVLSEQQRPLGIVKLQQVMPYLLSPARVGESNITTASVDFHQPIVQLEPSIIEPLTILSAQLSLNQFWAYVDESGDELTPNCGRCTTQKNTRVGEFYSCPASPDWAVVDEEGKFLGLLNSWLILKSTAASFTASPTANTSQPPVLNDLYPLVQLLEQLPLPLSLQTATGQVLAQNLTWRKQIGTSQDLDWVRRTTAAMLDFDFPAVEAHSASHSSAVSHDATRLVPLSFGEVALEENTVATLEATASQTLTSAPMVTGKSIKERYEPSQAAVQRYCAIDTPHMMATAFKQRVILSTPSGLHSAETPTSETLKNNIQERVFSFVKIPLLQPITREGRRAGAWNQHFNNVGQDLRRSPHPSPNSDLWLVLAQDTTEQQQVTKELAAKNADLVQLNRLKDEFLACISHELKTPLTAVLGLSSLLKDQALGELNERQSRYAQLIYQSGRQLMTVVNDILDLTRMETGQLELTLGPVHIQSVCDRAYSQAQQLHPEASQQDEESTPETRFTLEIEPGLEMLIADELRLRQMLMHLLSNALKFTDAGGEIGLRVNRWEDWIAFTIWDTGIGIPPEKQHLIFQKFQQLEKPLTRRFEGTGLGLVLTQRLAHLHGGDISFVSKLNEGSQFTLLLPPCPPQNSEQDGATQNWENGGNPKSQTPNPQKEGQQENQNRLVLIVETVPRYLEGLTEQLKNLDYRVVIARAGTEAIEKARSLQPCVILLNPLLPQLSGWDVLTLLKSDTQTLHIPVLVTATQAEKQQAYHHKADGFLSLPVQEQALLQNLTRLGKYKEGTRSGLTILHLHPDIVETQPDQPSLCSALTDILSLEHSKLNYRVLEADDLEQAELLTRVWHPDVVLLDGAALKDPANYLKEFSSYTDLTALPLVTLDHQTTEAANQITELSVYPCLAPDNDSKFSAILQVLQVATGMSRQPSILVMDVSIAQQEPDNLKVEPQMSKTTRQRKLQRRSCSESSAPTPHDSWLKGLIQYLETAGFKGLLSSSWAEVSRQLQEQSPDMLLICLKDVTDSCALMKGLVSLAQLPNLPPILVLDHRLEVKYPNKAAMDKDVSNSELESCLRSVATRIVGGASQSMTQLIDQVYQTMAQN
ncbi:response regulator [Microcoleus sp. FACHB-SPT15]|uniref:ATP-binding protein n=1 Tax=Microcoleus sp. FACHB-SPT15 TaxID=2692830 RepID=UPI00177BFC48|nr:ATP-binding protein [Microcoleus sp. FACHB-SPT15]MBD1808729.1 response regulator [Microcoleus sp. FACHB-SPT15]